MGDASDWYIDQMLDRDMELGQRDTPRPAPMPGRDPWVRPNARGEHVPATVTTTLINAFQE